MMEKMRWKSDSVQKDTSFYRHLWWVALGVLRVGSLFERRDLISIVGVTRENVRWKKPVYSGAR